MSDSDDVQEIQNETSVIIDKRKGRGRKRDPTKIVTQPKKARKERQLLQATARTEIPPQTAPQPLQAVIQTPLSVLQHPQTVVQPPRTGLLPSQTIQPLQAVPHPNDGSTPVSTFVQLTVPPNVFPSPTLNNTLQPPLQHTVPSSFAAPTASTMSLLNALNDDKLGIILPVLVRMEHKIDQLMAIVGAKLGQGIENHNLNAAVTRTLNNASGQVHVTSNTPQSNTTGSQQSTSTITHIQENAKSTVAQLFGIQIENEEDNTEFVQNVDKGFNAAFPGMTARQRIQLGMAKITEKTLPDDLNFPLSRDDLIALQAKSTSTMNFAVRLLREMFTPEELLGRNLSGVRGKEKVDPARVEVIKEIVFKIYRTSPSDRELLWRYCRKAMDSFLRKMQRPTDVVKVKAQRDPRSFQVTDAPVSEASDVTLSKPPESAQTQS